MKSLILGIITLVASASFAAEPELAFAEMTCDVYHTRMEDKMLKESKLIASSKGPRFELGMAQWLKTELPAPYQGVTVAFDHYNTYYNETGPQFKTPYLEASFVHNKMTIDKTRINFDILSPVEGSKILLRGTYKFSNVSLLAYDCYLIYVK